MSIRFNSATSVLATLILLFCSLTHFGQNMRERLLSIQDAHFEVIGAEDLGVHKSGRSPRDTLNLIVVYVPTKYVRQPYLSDFVTKIKSKLTESESFFLYFLDQPVLARDLLHLIETDDDDKARLHKTSKAIKALFVSVKNDKKESLRLFENGMTEKDFNALELELNN